MTVASPPVRDGAIRALRAGIELDDGRTAPARCAGSAPDTLELTIHEGRKRQVNGSAKRSAIACGRSSGSRSGRSSSATCAPGRTGA